MSGLTSEPCAIRRAQQRVTAHALCSMTRTLRWRGFPYIPQVDTPFVGNVKRTTPRLSLSALHHLPSCFFEKTTTATSAYVVGCWWTQDRKASWDWWQKINRQIMTPAMSSSQWELDYLTLCLQSADISSKHPYPTPTLNFVNVSPEQRQWTWRAG